MSTVEKDITFKSASELSILLENKEITSQELTRACIDRTEAVDGKLNAFITKDADAAMEQAAASDKRISAGKRLSHLDGIPVSLKDNICVENRKLTCGSKMLENYVSPYDATVTQKLKASGAVLWGSTNLDEFAMGSSTEHSFFGESSNPWDTDCVPGGSSGGSAVAVAAGETILSLGSDTGGSIRQPASYCGIVGFKPTYGLVSRYGLAAFASSLDQIGPFAHTIKDTAMITQVIAGHDNNDSTSYKVDIPNYTEALKHPRKYKLGIPKEYFGEGLHQNTRKAVQAAIDFYKSEGHEIVEVSLPHTDLAIPVYYIIAPAEASSNLSRYDGIRYTHRTSIETDAINIYKKSRAEGFGDEVKRRIMLGTYVLNSGYYDAYYLKAQKVRNLIRGDFMKAYEEQGIDAIIAPTVPSTAFKKGEKSGDPIAMYLEDIYTISVNLAGLPGLSLPCGFNPEGKPIGLQLIGKPYQEADLLTIAHVFESAHSYHNQHPTL